MSEREKFEKWLQQHDPDQSLTLAAEFPYYASYVTCMIAAAWQAALSTRKPYGYGIVDKDGKPAFGVTLTKSSADMHIRAYRDAGKAGHRVVELFYEDSES